MKKLSIITAFIFQTCMLFSADLSLYPLLKQAKYQPDKSVTLPAVLLDDELYKVLNSNYSNVRLTDSKNNLLPFTVKRLYKWKTVIEYKPVSGKITGFNVDYKRNEAVIDYEITSDANNKDLALGKLYLDSTLKKQFNKQVTLVFDDKSQESGLKFFNHSGTVAYFSQSFTFTPRKSKKIKIKIAPFLEKKRSASSMVREGNLEKFSDTVVYLEELSIKQIRFYSAEKKVYASNFLTDRVNIAGKKLDGKQQQTVWEFTLPGRVLYNLEFSSSTPKYQRNIKIELFRTIDSKETLMMAHNGTLSAGFKMDGNYLRPERAVITIDNGDNAELADPRFTWSFCKEAFFLDPASMKDSVVRIYYGGKNDTVPQFDLVKYIDNFNGMQYNIITPTKEEANPEFVKPTATWKWYLQKFIPWLLTVATVLLAFAAVKMMRKAHAGNTQDDW